MESVIDANVPDLIECVAHSEQNLASLVYLSAYSSGSESGLGRVNGIRDFLRGAQGTGAMALVWKHILGEAAQDNGGSGDVGSNGGTDGTPEDGGAISFEEGSLPLLSPVSSSSSSRSAFNINDDGRSEYERASIANRVARLRSELRQCGAMDHDYLTSLPDSTVLERYSGSMVLFAPSSCGDHALVVDVVVPLLLSLPRADYEHALVALTASPMASPLLCCLVQNCPPECAYIASILAQQFTRGIEHGIHFLSQRSERLLRDVAACTPGVHSTRTTTNPRPENQLHFARSVRSVLSTQHILPQVCLDVSVCLVGDFAAYLHDIARRSSDVGRAAEGAKENWLLRSIDDEQTLLLLRMQLNDMQAFAASADAALPALMAKYLIAARCLQILLLLILSRKPNNAEAGSIMLNAMSLALNRSEQIRVSGASTTHKDMQKVCHMNLQLVFSLLVIAYSCKVGEADQLSVTLKEMLKRMATLRSESTVSRMSYFFLHSAMVLVHDNRHVPMRGTDSSGKSRYHTGSSAAAWAIHTYTTRILGLENNNELLSISTIKSFMEALDRTFSAMDTISIRDEFTLLLDKKTEGNSTKASESGEEMGEEAGDWHACLLLTLLGSNWSQVFSNGLESPILTSVITSARWPLHSCVVKILDAWVLRVVFSRQKFTARGSDSIVPLPLLPTQVVALTRPLLQAGIWRDNDWTPAVVLPLLRPNTGIHRISSQAVVSAFADNMRNLQQRHHHHQQQEQERHNYRRPNEQDMSLLPAQLACYFELEYLATCKDESPLGVATFGIDVHELPLKGGLQRLLALASCTSSRFRVISLAVPLLQAAARQCPALFLNNAFHRMLSVNKLTDGSTGFDRPSSQALGAGLPSRYFDPLIHGINLDEKSWIETDEAAKWLVIRGCTASSDCESSQIMDMWLYVHKAHPRPQQFELATLNALFATVQASGRPDATTVPIKCPSYALLLQQPLLLLRLPTKWMIKPFVLKVVLHILATAVVGSRQESREALNSRRRVLQGLSPSSTEFYPSQSSGLTTHPAVSPQHEVFLSVQEVVVVRVLLALWRTVFSSCSNATLRMEARSHLSAFIETMLDVNPTGKLMGSLLHFGLEQDCFELLVSRPGLLQHLCDGLWRVMDVQLIGKVADAPEATTHASQRHDSLPFFTFTAEALCSHLLHLQHLIEATPWTAVVSGLVSDSAPFVLRSLRSMHVFQDTASVKRMTMELVSSMLFFYPECGKQWALVLQAVKLHEEPPLVKALVEAMDNTKNSKALLEKKTRAMGAVDSFSNPNAANAGHPLTQAGVLKLLEDFASETTIQFSSSKHSIGATAYEEGEWNLDDDVKPSAGGKKKRKKKA